MSLHAEAVPRQQTADPAAVAAAMGRSLLFPIEPLASPGGDTAKGRRANTPAISGRASSEVGVALSFGDGPKAQDVAFDPPRSIEQPGSMGQFSKRPRAFGNGLRFTVGPSNPGGARPQRSTPSEGIEGAPVRRGYVGFLAFISVQPAGDTGGQSLVAGLGDNSLGATGVVGAFLDPHVSVEAEASVGPSLTTEQWLTSQYRYATVYRDMLFSGFVRWHKRPFQRNLLEPVLGITVAAGRAARTTVSYSYPGALGGQPFDASVRRIRLGVGGGADLVVPAGKGIAAVASFRMYVLTRPDDGAGPPELSGRFVYRFGAGLQWSY